MCLAGGVFGAVVGFTVAAQTSEPSPDPLSLRRPRVGDQGEYSVTVTRSTAEGVTIMHPERLLGRFEWLPDGTARDHRGIAHVANRLRYTEYAPGSKDVVELTTQVAYFDASSSALLAVSHEEANLENESHFAGRKVGEYDKNDVVILDGMTAVLNLLCGLRNTLQDQVLDPTKGHVLFPQCYLRRTYSQDLAQSEDDEFLAWLWNEHYPRPLEDDAFYYQGRATNDRPSMIFKMLPENGFDHGVRLAFDEETGYPLQYEMPTFKDPKIVNIIRLTRFHAGSKPITGPNVGATVANSSPALNWTGYSPLGPDETGIQHPFSFFQAFDWARYESGDQTLNRFLLAHPSAYTIKATYYEQADDDVLLRRWDFSLTDSQDFLTLGVEQNTGPIWRDHIGYNPVPPGILPDFVINSTTVYFSNQTTEEFLGSLHDYPPPPAWLPKSMPTVESIGRLWEEFARPNLASRGFNAWGWEVHCGGYVINHACTRYTEMDLSENGKIKGSGSADAEIQLSVGYQRDLWGSWNPISTDLEFVVSYLRVNQNGIVQGFLQNYKHQQSTIDPTALVLSDGEPATTLAVAVSPLPTWKLPTGGYALATGILVLLAGLTGWLWPTTKSGSALPLFSRVTKSTALDQPGRAQVADVVTANPGIHLQEIARRTGMSPSTTAYHLRKLVDVGLVAEQTGAGFVCYFPKGAVDRRVMAAAPVLKSNGARQVLSAIAAQPGSSAAHIADSLGYTRQTVSYHLARLKGAQLVEVAHQGHELRLSVTQVGRDVLAQGVSA